MNYWIFVLGKTNPEAILECLIEKENWGFWKESRVDNLLNLFEPGDKVVFYIAGKNRMYLAGECTLSSAIKPPNRKSINCPEKELSGIVEFESVEKWEEKRLFLSDLRTREKLNFIKNKERWGSTFLRSLILIQKADYDNIKKLVNRGC